MPLYKDLQGNRHEIPSVEYEHILPEGSVRMTTAELLLPSVHPELSLELQIASKEAKGMSLRKLREAIIAGTLSTDMAALETDLAVVRNKIKERDGKL